ncbi:unnamed protein product, partial [Brenthis ino]
MKLFQTAVFNLRPKAKYEYCVYKAFVGSKIAKKCEGEPGGRRRCAGAGGVSRGMRRRPLLLLLALLLAHGLLAASGGVLWVQYILKVILIVVSVLICPNT